MIAESIISIPASRCYETSHKQRRDWSYAQSLKAANKVYKIYVLENVNNLNVELFEKAIGVVIRCNDSLRTNFVKKDGQLVQVVQDYDSALYKTRYIDCRGVFEKWKCNAFIKSEYRRVVDYQSEPLFSALILRRNNNRYTVAIFVEHIIFDAISISILKNEIRSHYARLLNKEVLPAIQKTFQLKDYVAWRNQCVLSKANMSYWKEMMEKTGFTVDLERFYKKCGIQKFRKMEGVSGNFKGFIGDGLIRAIDELAKLFKTSRSFLMTAVFVLLMSALFEQNSLLISMIFMGRELSQFNELVACCAEPVFLFINVDPGLNVHGTIKMIERVFFSSIQHFFPWGEIHENPAPGRYIAQVNYVSHDAEAREGIRSPRSLHKKEKSCVRRPYSFLTLTERANCLEFLFVYSLEVYSEKMIRVVFEKYVALLEKIRQSPDIRIADLMKSY